MSKPIYNFLPYSDSEFLEQCKTFLASNELLPLDFLDKFGKTNNVKWYKILVAVFDGKATGKVHLKYVRKEYELLDSMLNDDGFEIYKEHVYEVDEDRSIDTQKIQPVDIEDFKEFTFVSGAPKEVLDAVSHLYDRICLDKTFLKECDKFPENIYERINEGMLNKYNVYKNKQTRLKAGE